MPTRDRQSLGCRTAIRMRGAEAAGLCGALLFDAAAGETVALSAAQLVRPGRDLLIETPEQDCFNVRRFRQWLTEEETQDAAHLLVAVLIPHTIELDPTDDLFKKLSTKTANPWDDLGSPVLIWGGSEEPVSAILKSTQASFYMPRPTDGVRTEFIDALELKGKDNRAILKKTDIGAVVTREDGTLLGIVVGGNAKLALAAPVAPILNALHLAPLTFEQLSKRRRVKAGPSVFAEYKNDLTAAQRIWKSRSTARLRLFSSASAEEGRLSPEEIEEQTRKTIEELAGPL